MSKPLALVTGGAHRLGKAFALTLARMGYDLLLQYHSAEEQAQKTKKELESLGVKVHLVKADLTQPEQIQSLFFELDLQDWDSALDLNLRAPFLLAQQAAKRMTAGGLIVNITDVGAQKAWSRYPSYSVSKAGLESLTKLLARALAPSIRVNAIAPGLVLPSDVVTKEQWNQLVEKLPLKRAATLDEITYTLQFLIHNEYITGQTIVVDGGYSLL